MSQFFFLHHMFHGWQHITTGQVTRGKHRFIWSRCYGSFWKMIPRLGLSYPSLCTVSAKCGQPRRMMIGQKGSHLMLYSTSQVPCVLILRFFPSGLGKDTFYGMEVLQLQKEARTHLCGQLCFRKAASEDDVFRFHGWHQEMGFRLLWLAVGDNEGRQTGKLGVAKEKLLFLEVLEVTSTLSYCILSPGIFIFLKSACKAFF